MPRLHIDAREAISLKPLPDDTYDCKVLSISAPKKGEKSTFVEVVFEVIDGEHAGAKIYQNMPIDGKGAGIFVDFYNKITGEELDIDDLEDLDVDTDELVGEEIGVTTVQEEYPEGSGDFRHKVKKLVAA